MLDFYQNMVGIHPMVSTWVHMDMLFLPFFLNNKSFFKGIFVEAFSPICQFSDEFVQNATQFCLIFIIIHIQCYDKYMQSLKNIHFLLNIKTNRFSAILATEHIISHLSIFNFLVYKPSIVSGVIYLSENC